MTTNNPNEIEDTLPEESLEEAEAPHEVAADESAEEESSPTDAAEEADVAETDDSSEAAVEFEGDRPIVRELQYQAPKGKAAAEAEEDGQEPEFHSVAEAKAVIEGFLFSVNEPLSVNKLSKLLSNLHPKTVRGLLLELQWDYDNRGGALQIIEIAGGYQMSTRAFVAPWMFRMHKHKRRSAVSPATLETLAIIAYRQPITKGEIETIRGVESGAPLRTLQELSLIEANGRREVVGRPQLYITTDQFLKAFGLKSVGDLPSIAELKTRFAEDTRLKAAVAQSVKEEKVEPESPAESEATEQEESPLQTQGAFEAENSLDPIESEFDIEAETIGEADEDDDDDFDDLEDELSSDDSESSEDGDDESDNVHRE